MFLIEECVFLFAGKIMKFLGIFAIVSVSAFLIAKLMAELHV